MINDEKSAADQQWSDLLALLAPLRPARGASLCHSRAAAFGLVRRAAVVVVVVVAGVFSSGTVTRHMS